MLRAHGARHVIVVDPNEDNRRRALSFGANAASAPDDIASFISDAAAGRGADIAVELSGASSAVSSAIAQARIGATVVLAGSVSPVGAVAIDPWLYILFAAFAIVAAANGVNLTDGLDGLSGGTVAIAFVAYMLIALLNVPNQANLALLCALIIGALLGFLWFNVHPAQIFIGDSGALSLGATLAVTALITGQILVLPLIGLIFVVETLSVIIQVVYFKATGGKRLFRFTPLHHHFELGGWDEEKITVRFWIVGILAALLGVTLFLAGPSAPSAYVEAVTGLSCVMSAEVDAREAAARVVAAPGDQALDTIFAAVVQKGLALRRFESRGASLEEVFVELTTVEEGVS